MRRIECLMVAARVSRNLEANSDGAERSNEEAARHENKAFRRIE